MEDDVPRDAVDQLLDSWAEQHPELEDQFRAVDVITRLLRLRGHIESGLHGLFREFGLGAPDFTALVTLARIGGADGVPQQRLAEALGLTSGTVSVRIDQLVARGLAERRPDPDSRRSTLVGLTPAGSELFERMIPAHLRNEERLLAALSPEERRQLTGLLRRLLVEFEGPVTDDDRLGLVLAPAHQTIAMRESVGLPGVAGLLVRTVAAGSPAARAGIKAGDVLLEGGGHALRSLASLYAAVRATGAAPLKLTVLRGTDRLDVVVTLAPPEKGRPTDDDRPAGGRRAVKGRAS
jgi:DNA-binding MarR family transcriptional regulator